MCNTLEGSANTSPTVDIPLCAAAALKILRHAEENAQCECALSVVDGGPKVAEWQLLIDT